MVDTACIVARPTPVYKKNGIYDPKQNDKASLTIRSSISLEIIVSPLNNIIASLCDKIDNIDIYTRAEQSVCNMVRSVKCKPPSLSEKKRSKYHISSQIRYHHSPKKKCTSSVSQTHDYQDWNLYGKYYQILIIGQDSDLGSTTFYSKGLGALFKLIMS